jgi:hypothetical protein
MLISNKAAIKKERDIILRKRWIKEDDVMKGALRHANLSLNKYVRMQTCENELHKKVHCSVWTAGHQQSLHTVASAQHCLFSRSEFKNSGHELMKLHKTTSQKNHKQWNTNSWHNTNKQDGGGRGGGDVYLLSASSMSYANQRNLAIT